MKAKTLMPVAILTFIGFILGPALPAQGQEWLIAMGDINSFRGTNVPSPDPNGHYWNAVDSAHSFPSLTNINGQATGLALSFDNSTGNDSYNGPAGITFNPNNVVVNNAALGDLGYNYGVYHYYVNSGIEIQGMDPSKQYNLTFFGSHAFSTDTATTYSLYGDHGYSNALQSISLNVQDPNNASQWNTGQVAVFNNVSPQSNGIMYIGFTGANGNLGYLNALEIQVSTGIVSNPASNTVSTLRGATVPWTTYEAENMTNNGTVLGPSYVGNDVASESSGRQCVRLNATGQFIQFTAQSNANAMVVRYSVPDTANGVGTNYTLSLYKNGVFTAKLPMTSMYSWLYGVYSNGTPAFGNNPANGNPRNFYDEVRTNGLSINAGDVVKLQKDTNDTAAFYNIDLVDLENAPVAIGQPGGSVSIKSSPYNAQGDGVNDDTTALQLALNGTNSVYLPPGNYKITASINIASNKTIQGAGMWYTTLVGDPTLYTTSSRRVTLNGVGSNIHLSDLAVIGKLNYRNDNEPNDGLGGSYGTGSTISNIWVEHTKTGAWIINSLGLVVNGCRFRDTIADGINLVVGMRSCIVTNCTARGTGDDCFPIWPATYNPGSGYPPGYTPGLNVVTHCTGQTPFLANGGAIYGGVSNRIEDCLFQDIPYDCGILISTTFPVGANMFSGTTVAQRCDLIRCGGTSAGAGLQICLNTVANGLSGLNLNNLNIVNSASDGMSIIGGLGTPATGTLTNAIMYNVNIPNYGSGHNGLWARSDAVGSLMVSNCTVVEYKNDSSNFHFNFVTSNVPVAVQTSPSGQNFTADGTNYSSAQVFNWLYGSSHTLATTSPQNEAAGVQYVWNSWSDSGTISHSVTVNTNITYTANFSTQYFLTMNSGTGGSVSPTNSWNNSNVVVSISATTSNGYVFSGWTGSGTGSYSGTSNPASITMNGPITETANFTLIPTRLISLSGNLSFGDVAVGGSSNLTFTISNTGNSTLTVSGITYSTGFSGNWSGTISSGGSTNVTATFAPIVAGNYTGNLTVNSDATVGFNTVSLSGTGVATTNVPPDNLTVSGVAINPDSSMTISYATTSGFTYHVEVTSDLVTGTWTILTSSITNAADGTVTFTDPGAAGSPQRFYRVRSP